MDVPEVISPTDDVERHWNSLHGRERGNHPKRRRDSSESSRQPQEVGLMRDGDQNGPGRFVGSSSGIHFIRNVYVRLAEKPSNGLGQRTPNESLIPGEDDQLHGNGNVKDDEDFLWTPEETLKVHNYSDNASKPSFEQLVSWTKSYFENWHPAFPLVHAPAVLKILEQISNGGIEELSPADLMVVRSIISISLMDARQCINSNPPVMEHLVFQSIADVFAQTQIALSHPASLPIVQSTLCVQLFLISLLRFNSASRLGGLVIRMAFQLGLHRCPTRFPFSPLEAEMRKRIFWTIYCLERLLCNSLGLPLDIHDDDIDVCYPDNELHIQHSADQVYGDQTKTDQSRLKLLTYLAKHARIRGMIVELRHKSVLHRQNTFSRATVVEGELARWMNEIYEAIGMNEDDTESQEDPPLLPVHQLLLSVLQQESIISLNRPLMTSSPENPAHLTAIHNCINAARTTISALSHFQRRHSAIDGTESHKLAVPMIWPSLTWAAWMSCFILAFTAAEGQLKTTSVTRYFKDTSAVLRHLALRGSPWPNFCASRINELISTLTQESILSKTNRVLAHPHLQRRSFQGERASLNNFTSVSNPATKTGTRPPMGNRSSSHLQGIHSQIHTSHSESGLRTPPSAVFYGSQQPSESTFEDRSSTISVSHDSQSAGVQDRVSRNESPSNFQQYQYSAATTSYSSPSHLMPPPQRNNFLSLTSEQVLPATTAEDGSIPYSGQYPADPFSVMELSNLAAGQYDIGLESGSTPNWGWQVG